MRPKTMLGWHFLPADRRLRYGTRELVEVGRTYCMSDKPVLCKRGFHASKRPLDALDYAPGPIICRVRLSGKIVTGEDKATATRRTVLAMADATDLLHEFACRCAEVAMLLDEVDDDCCWDAIEAKRAWVRGEISDAEMDTAFSAVLSAALSASFSTAFSAALGAASDMSWNAAQGTAWTTARGAMWSLAQSAIRSEENGLLEHMLAELLHAKGD